MEKSGSKDVKIFLHIQNNDDVCCSIGFVFIMERIIPYFWKFKPENKHIKIINLKILSNA